MFRKPLEVRIIKSIELLVNAYLMPSIKGPFGKYIINRLVRK
ncbi:hypothetical protein [Desulfofalx alkaliphila]|nr:hypothetical protein [Desulfofalx alkaliphila]